MAETIKTLALLALKNLLKGVAGLGSVNLEAELPFDLDTIPAKDRPALFIWDDSDDPQGGNRLIKHDLEVLMALFLPLGTGGFPAFSQAAEVIAARIHAKLAAPVGLRAAGIIQITQGTIRKALANEKWGEMIIPCRIDYRHARGNAFTTILS